MKSTITNLYAGVPVSDLTTGSRPTGTVSAT